MSERRHWFHCCQKFHGITWSAVRRPPLAIEFTSEPHTPRLCVGPTVAACFAARLFDDDRDVFVYRTVKPRRGVKPRGVWDSVITDERWLIPPVELEFHQLIPARMVRAAQRRSWKHCRRAIEAGGDPYGTPRGRLHSYRDACRVLGAVGNERIIIEQALARFFVPARRLAR